MKRVLIYVGIRADIIFMKLLNLSRTSLNSPKVRTNFEFRGNIREFSKIYKTSIRFIDVAKIYGTAELTEVRENLSMSRNVYGNYTKVSEACSIY